jgi:hypothetical protein
VSTTVIRIVCPTCGKQMHVSEEHAGRTGKCPACHGAVAIPSDLTESRQSGSHTPLPESVSIKQCDFCGETILSAAKKCKHCGEFLDPVLRMASDASRTPRVAEGKPSDSDIMVHHLQLKKSHAAAVVLNILWPGAGVVYSGNLKGWVIAIVALPIYALSPVLYGIPILILCIWSIVLSYEAINSYNMELLLSLRNNSLNEFQKKQMLQEAGTGTVSVLRILVLACLTFLVVMLVLALVT